MASYLSSFVTAFPAVWSQTVSGLVDRIGKGPTYVAVSLLCDETIGFWPGARRRLECRGRRCLTEERTLRFRRLPFCGAGSLSRPSSNSSVSWIPRCRQIRLPRPLEDEPGQADGREAHQRAVERPPLGPLGKRTHGNVWLLGSLSVVASNRVGGRRGRSRWNLWQSLTRICRRLCSSAMLGFPRQSSSLSAWQYLFSASTFCIT